MSAIGKMFRRKSAGQAHDGEPEVSAAAPRNPTTRAEAIERVRSSRDAIGTRVSAEMIKGEEDVRRMGLPGVMAEPSEAGLRQWAIQYPIWAIAKLIEDVSGLAPGPDRDAAMAAARSLAQRFADEHFGETIRSLVEMQAKVKEAESRDFVAASDDRVALLGKQAEFKTDLLTVGVDRLTDVAIAGFVDGLGAAAA